MRKALLVLLAPLLVLIAFAQTNSLERRVKVRAGKIVTEYYNSNIVVRVEGVSTKTNSTGAPIAGYTKLYQDGKLALEENWGPTSETQRIYYRNGRQIVTEMDEDGDGIPEWVIVFGENGKACEVFKFKGRGKIELLGTGATEEFNRGLEQSKDLIEAITNRATRPSPGSK